MYFKLMFVPYQGHSGDLFIKTESFIIKVD